MTFAPRFAYSDAIVGSLLRIEGARAVIELLPLPPDATLLLRQEARRRATRSSTAIEGNTLDEEEVRRALAISDRDPTEAEQEVRNYWRALDRVEDWATGKRPVVSEAFVQELHRIVIVLPRGRHGHRSAYRTGAVPVVDTATRTVEYAPPEGRDVPALMADLVSWLGSSRAAALPAPLRAGLLAHRLLSIHPFPDGNGRTARLLATAELWRSCYRMRGFLSFDEHFAADRASYYDALQMGLPVNYYEGRHDPDHTPWLAYFLATLASAADELRERATALYRRDHDTAMPWEKLDRQQQQVITRLAAAAADGSAESGQIRPRDLEDWFEVSANTARDRLRDWSEDGFVVPVATARGQRVRRHRLADRWAELLALAPVRRAG